MAYELWYHPDVAARDLPRIPRNIRETIRRAIEERLTGEPLMYGEPLRQSLKGHRKLRVGDYRVIYEIGDEIRIVRVNRVRHRREVYR